VLFPALEILPGRVVAAPERGILREAAQPAEAAEVVFRNMRVFLALHYV
jgi:hypothetical protein